MFGKSHEQKASEHAAIALDEARAAARQRFAERAGGQTSHMRDTVVEKAGVAGERWQHGVDAVSPKMQAAMEAAAPKVEHAKETFVEDVLPKVAETIAAVTATALAAKESAKAGAETARENAAVKLQDYVDQAPQEWVDAIPGVEKRPKKSGKWLILLGLAAAGAAAYAVVNSRKTPEDPWSTPRYDSTGAQQTYGAGAGAGGTSESKVEAVKEKAAAAGAAVAAKAGEVKEKAQDKAGEVKDKAGEAKDKAQHKDAKDHAQDSVDSTKDAAGDVADDLRGKDAGDKLADAGDSARKAGSDAWTEVGNVADDKTDGAQR